MALFKPGDEVVITNMNEYPGNPGVEDSMLQYIGQTKTIKYLYPYGCDTFPMYELEDAGGWTYDERWLELVHDEPINVDESEILSLF